MARTYRKTAADAVEDGKKLKRMDRRHGTAVVADGAQCHSTAADIYVLDGKHIRYDRRSCDDRSHEIPNAKRKIKRGAARAIRRAGRMNGWRFCVYGRGEGHPPRIGRENGGQ